MQTKVMVGIVVGLAVVVAGYVFYQSKSSVVDDLSQMGQNNENGTQLAEGEGNADGKKMAFMNFVKQGGAYKCEIHQSVQGVDTVGTAYINGGLIRGEYNTKVQGMSIDTTFIVRDGYTYTWNSMLAGQGFKAKVVENVGGDASTGTSGSYGFDENTIGDYNCEAWTPDIDKFSIPKNITFKAVN
jgi:hypothetical protein